jgi:hypothetical protein
VFGLPLELKLVILDFLSHPRDAGTASVAFGWDVPDSYWRNRFPCHLIYEIADIPSEKLDLPRIFIAFGEFLHPLPWGLENRQRILGYICRIRELFEDELEKGSAQGISKTSLAGRLLDWCCQVGTMLVEGID